MKNMFKTGHILSSFEDHDEAMNDITSTQPTSDHAQTVFPTTLEFGNSDHRSDLARAMRIAENTVANVGEAMLDRPTPCEHLTVGQLIGHLIFVGQRLEAMYTGQSDTSLDPWRSAGTSPSEAALALAAQNAIVEELLTQDGMLDRTIVPWRPMTVRESLPCYVSEFTVHTWDLATATGLAVDWDEDIVALSQKAMECEIPADYRSAIFAAVLADAPDDVEVPFGEAHPAPEGAPSIDQLAAYVGRSLNNQ